MAKSSQRQGLAKVPAVPKNTGGKKKGSSQATAPNRSFSTIHSKTTRKETYTKETVIFDPVYRYTPLPEAAKEKFKIKYDTTYPDYVSSGDEVEDPDSEGDEGARKIKRIVKSYKEKSTAQSTKHITYCEEGVSVKKAKNNHLVPYNKEVVINLYNSNVPVETIAKLFGSGEATIYRTIADYLKTGSIGGRKVCETPSPVLQKVHKWALRCWLIEEPQHQIKDLKAMLEQAFELKVSESTVYRAVRGMRFAWKVGGVSPYRRNCDEIIKIRAKYAEIFLHLLSMGNTNKIYYIDESSFNLAMRFNKGYFYVNDKNGVIKKHAVRSQGYSMVALLSKSGLDMYQMILGSHNGKTFHNFLTLAIAHIKQNLSSGNAIIVLDNASVHKVDEIKTLVDWIDPATWKDTDRTPDNKVRLLFLPAYSPFLNPIEEVFGWLKHHVKRNRPTNAEGLFDLLQLMSRNLSADMTQRFYDHANTFLADSRISKPIK